MKLLLTLWMCCLICTACASTSTSQTAAATSTTSDKTKSHQVTPEDRYHPFEWAQGEKYTMPPGIPES